MFFWNPIFFYFGIPVALAAVGLAFEARGQNQIQGKKLRAGSLLDDFKLDGDLGEASWESTDYISNLTMIAPKEGGNPSERTVVRVLSNEK